jgi:Xaa-Pro dipeptidase
MPYDQFQYLFESLKGCKIFDADGFLRAMRMVKSERECDQIHRSSRIVSRGFAFIAETPFPRIDQRKLEAMLKRETHYEGAEDFRMLIAKPLDSPWAFRPAEEEPLSPGETVIVYLATEYERYWSEGIRTFVVEDPSLVEVKSEGLQSLYQQILEGMKPGKEMSQFYKETFQAIRKGKMDPIQEYGFGQGIGLSTHEFPQISNKDETVLKEGMCFTLRLGIKDPERGALFIGNTLCLSKKGPEVLTR